MAPVAQGNTVAGNDNTGAKARVVALYIRNHVAFSVGRTKIYRTATIGIDRLWPQGSLAYFAAPFGSVRFREPVLYRGLHKARVGNIFLTVYKSQLHGFDLAVEGLYRITLCKVQTPGYIEGHEDDQSVAVRRYFPNIVATVGRMDRFYPLGLIFL